MYRLWVGMFNDVETPPNDQKWSVLTQTWDDQGVLVWANGLRASGCRPWHEVNTLLVSCNVGGYHWIMVSIDLVHRDIHLYDPFMQKVPFNHRNKHVACLRWLLPLMLAEAGFYSKRTSDQLLCKVEADQIHMAIVSRPNVPQQSRG
ncbi:hypothetical protein LWI29_024842 [Acer saccharum]|uniref:Ubiquitin-like protease family profile domain-containing protein n=1 Tax=Acer saccharum TaxID=4024 RepID=A0AA39SWG7_ACESA|nr:hypothetical protein LWI29_024842 [Acer saccharum]